LLDRLAALLPPPRVHRHRHFGVLAPKVYFCDPQNPWQRGSNENTNGLLRQYFPREQISQAIRKQSSTPWPED